MKNNKLSLILFIIPILLILVPISVVLVTDIKFNSFYTNIFVNTAIFFVILGKILNIIKKTKADREVQWAGIGSITVFLILLVWNIFRNINL